MRESRKGRLTPEKEGGRSDGRVRDWNHEPRITATTPEVDTGPAEQVAEYSPGWSRLVEPRV